MYRKIYGAGKKELPKDTPMIFAMNHPTAFIEPMFPPTLDLSMNTAFLLRGDFFKPGLANWFLNHINCIPVFRRRGIATSC